MSITTLCRNSLVFLLVAPGALSAASPPEIKPPAEPLATLRPEHPRLMLPASALQALKARAAEDKTLARYVQQVLAQAEKLLAAPALTYDKQGPRLLHVSRECLRRTYALALAYRWTGETRFAEAARGNLVTVCNFKDWNDSHFLDVAEMSHAVAIGYDWLNDWLDAGTKELLVAKLIEYGLQEGIEEYEAWTGWPDSEHNWNQVCNSGLIIGALAIAETRPDYAERILPLACKSLPHALVTYAPDGAWPEGPSYWEYATNYTAHGLGALNTALGTDFGLSKFPGMAETGLFPVYATGATGLFLNFADSGERNKRDTAACMFWLAKTYNNSTISDLEHAALEQHEATPQHVMWYLPPSGKEPALDLDRLFRGPVPVAVFRSAWDDPNALFVGVKGGYNQVNHGHLDLGNFELDALGVRWARDLGSDDYNLPGYFAKMPGGKRWQYYRMRSASHNVPLMNGHDQRVLAEATVADFKRGKSPSVTIDLSGAYPGAKKVTRRISLVDKRTAVLCQDIFRLEQPAEIVWGMTTDAEIALNGQEAVLTQDGKRMTVTLVRPKGSEWSVESAEQPAPEKPNTGVSRLTARINAAAGQQSFLVRFSW
ncbi:MAG: heparinase II/III family protein [Candidatus Hydrogenedentes bacterium]|nr:heparinase II/III family protein [Candidatus Hydrogenedentota bacterium]